MPALAALAVALSAAGASAAPQAAPRVSPEALLAADVPWSTVQAVGGESYWPELPAFNSIVDQEDPQPLTAVAQTYEQIGGSSTIVTRLYAYASSELALEFLQSNAIVVEQIDQQRPVVGDRHFYFVTKLSDGSPSTRLFFIEGRIGVEIQVDSALWSRSKIAGLADPIDRQLRQLLAGTFRAPAIPAAQLALLPAATAAPGPVLGTASIPAAAWATVSHNGSPRAIRDGLVRNGDATLPFRRYLRRGSNRDVIEVTLFCVPERGGRPELVCDLRSRGEAASRRHARSGRHGRPVGLPLGARQLRAPVRRRPLCRRRLLLGAVCRRPVAGLRGCDADAGREMVLRS